MTYLLFTTLRCPKCPEAKEWFISQLDMDYEIVTFETHPMARELAAKYGIMSVPTVVNEDTGEVHEFTRFKEEYLYELSKNM